MSGAGGSKTVTMTTYDDIMFTYVGVALSGAFFGAGLD